VTPEQKARANIDGQLATAGWTVQDHKAMNLGAAGAIAVREFPLDTGPVGLEHCLAADCPGACEIRVRDREGAFRVVYVARFRKAVYVLHAFQKKSQKTSRRDVELAWARYRDARALDEE
jgi:Gp49-like protein DUF891